MGWKAEPANLLRQKLPDWMRQALQNNPNSRDYPDEDFFSPKNSDQPSQRAWAFEFARWRTHGGEQQAASSCKTQEVKAPPASGNRGRKSMR